MLPIEYAWPRDRWLVIALLVGGIAAVTLVMRASRLGADSLFELCAVSQQWISEQHKRLDQ